MSVAQYKKPDLHAKRNRETPPDYLAYPAKDPYGFFARIKKQYPQLTGYDNKEIAGWITEYNKQMAADVVINREGVVLPEGLGAVVTGICKPTEKTASNNINHSASKMAGATITFRNAHSNGYLAKVYYTNDMPRCRFTNHQMWAFKPVRALSRAVSAAMKNEASYSRYIVFTKRFAVSALFDKDRTAKYVKRKGKQQKTMAIRFAEYDEFYISED